MHIEPNSTVIVCKDVPWDPDYTHAMNWASMGKETQASIVKTYQKFEFNRMTYQRSNRGYIRVEKCVDDLYDCNYLMFQNTNYGDKWFYAFITRVDYINDITTEIEYEIDVITTWWFDCAIGKCFIERAHSILDKPGDNLVPEDLETGEYVISKEFWCIPQLNQMSVVVCTSFGYNRDTHEIIDDDSNFERRGRLPCALHYTAFSIDNEAGVEGLNTMIGEVNKQGKISGVLCLYIAPTFATQHFTSSVNGLTIPVPYGRPLSIGNYTPRNKKLLTYPYSMLYVTDAQGNANIYPYEYFDTDEGSTQEQFLLIATIGPTASVTLAPKNYKGGYMPIDAINGGNFDQSMTLSNYPQIAYVNDVFKNWLALNKVNLLGSKWGNISATYMPNMTLGKSYPAEMQGMSIPSFHSTALTGAGTTAMIQSAGPAINFASNTAGAANGASGAGSLYLAYAAAQLVSTITNAVRQTKSHSLQPDVVGGVQDNNLMCSANLQNFFFSYKQIREEFAKIIDDYFDMFGYAIHRIGQPIDYIGARKSHCYIKTIGAHLDGSVPSDAAKAICGVYDHGITFWESQDRIGHYEDDNSPRN